MLGQLQFSTHVQWQRSQNTSTEHHKKTHFALRIHLQMQDDRNRQKKNDEIGANVESADYKLYHAIVEACKWPGVCETVPHLFDGITVKCFDKEENYAVREHDTHHCEADIFEWSSNSK